MDTSMRGWNWGDFSLSEEGLDLKVEEKPMMSIKFPLITNCTVPNRSEIALELRGEGSDDCLTEIRLFIPDTDSCESLSSSLLDHTDSKIDEVVASLSDMPFLVPRGKYSIDMLSNSMRMHGKTHNYKIMYTNIIKAYLLPNPDDLHIALVINLEVPIRQGNMIYQFLVIQFHKESEENLTLVNPPQSLTETIEGKTFDVVSRLLKELAGVSIIVPGAFKSHRDNFAIKCSIKASEGLLYPMQKSFIFIFKPVIYIKFEDISSIEFSRVTERKSNSNRSFDVNIRCKNARYQFTGIDRNEYSLLLGFIEKKKINVKNIEEEETKEPSNIMEMMQDDDEDDESFREEDSDDNIDS